MGTCSGSNDRGSTTSAPRSARRLLPLVVCALAVPLVFGTATATAQSFDDPSGDVLTCTGECSTFDQDLSGVTVESSGGQVSFTIEQYGSFTGATACRCFFPQLHIYLGSALPAKPDYYTAEWTGSPPASGIIRPIALFDRSLTQTGTGVNNCPIPGGFNGVGKLADILPASPSATPSATSVTYAFDLAAIGNPGSFDWRIAEPAASTCQTQGNPEPNPRDVLPDSGLATYAPAGGGSCDDARAKLEQAKKKIKKAKKALKQAKQNGTDAQVAKAKKKLKQAKKKVKKANSAVEAACG
jgi:hypothetical protein